MSQSGDQDKDLEQPAQPEAAAEDEQLSEADRPEKKAYDIDIFRAWCKACGICAAFCPRHCIGVDEEGAPVVEKSERCTGCGWCELHCPDFAISVHPRQAERPRTSEED